MRSTIELRRLWSGAGAVLLLATSPAMTQTRQLEEVVVTAQKRVQSLQDVAIAVSAFSGADLEDAGVLTIENLTAMTPGLAISSYNPATPAPYIRGVGTNSSSVGDDASVGVFINEVYAGRAGGFNALAATAEEAAVPFDPETASNYEAGMKADLFDRRLRRNAAAFFMDYEDLQNFFLDDGAVVTATADAEIKGFELEAWASLAEGLELSTSWGYLDTEYTSFPGTPDNEGNN